MKAAQLNPAGLVINVIDLSPEKFAKALAEDPNLRLIALPEDHHGSIPSGHRFVEESSSFVPDAKWLRGRLEQLGVTPSSLDGLDENALFRVLSEITAAKNK